MPSFVPSGPPTEGSFSVGTSDTPGVLAPVIPGAPSGMTPADADTISSYDGISLSGFSGVYGELGIRYGESLTIFRGVVGVWRYGGFMAIFGLQAPPTTGSFSAASDGSSGAFISSTTSSGAFSASPPGSVGSFDPQ